MKLNVTSVCDGLVVGTIGPVCLAIWRTKPTPELFEVQRLQLASAVASDPTPIQVESGTRLASFCGMPTAHEILRGLHTIANEAIGISLGWHIAAGITVIALLAGVRPEKRFAAAILSLPLASVSALAFAFDNPFNGAVFALLAIALAALAMGASRDAVTLGRPWAVALGAFLLAFGWVYPHFLEGEAWFVYLYAAPLGAIPCPTLSAVVGAALIAGGFGLGAWRLTLAAVASFYALFGVMRLGVAIDVVLLAGVVGLVIQYLQDRGLRSSRGRNEHRLSQHLLEP